MFEKRKNVIFCGKKSEFYQFSVMIWNEFAEYAPSAQNMRRKLCVACQNFGAPHKNFLRKLRIFHKTNRFAKKSFAVMQVWHGNCNV